MEEKVRGIYKKLRFGRCNAIVLMVVLPFVLIGLASLFLGSPLPHKQKILSIEIWQDGWWRTRESIGLFCVIAGVIAGIGIVVFPIIRQISQYHKLFTQQCNIRAYLEILEYAMHYGSTISLKGWQKLFYSILKQYYVLALTAAKEFEQAEAYLTDQWKGKRTQKAYQIRLQNLQLAHAFAEKNKVNYLQEWKSVDPLIQKNSLFLAQKYLLEEEYEQAIKLLLTQPEKIPYNQNVRAYLLGICYMQSRRLAEAKQHLQYVADHSNTMPCREEAVELLQAI